MLCLFHTFHLSIVLPFAIVRLIIIIIAINMLIVIITANYHCNFCIHCPSLIGLVQFYINQSINEYGKLKIKYFVYYNSLKALIFNKSGLWKYKTLLELLSQKQTNYN